MRLLILAAVLLACLSNVGCGTLDAKKAPEPSPPAGIAQVIKTDTGTERENLLKASPTSATTPQSSPAGSPPSAPTATPTSPSGPLSCVEQHIQAVSKGDLFPTDTQCK